MLAEIYYESGHYSEALRIGRRALGDLDQHAQLAVRSSFDHDRHKLLCLLVRCYLARNRSAGAATSNADQNGISDLSRAQLLLKRALSDAGGAGDLLSWVELLELRARIAEASLLQQAVGDVGDRVQVWSGVESQIQAVFQRRGNERIPLDIYDALITLQAKACIAQRQHDKATQLLVKLAERFPLGDPRADKTWAAIADAHRQAGRYERE